MQSIEQHPRLTDSGTQSGAPEICILARPPGDSDAHSSWETTEIDCSIHPKTTFVDFKPC